MSSNMNMNSSPGYPDYENRSNNPKRSAPFALILAVLLIASNIATFYFTRQRYSGTTSSSVSSNFGLDPVTDKIAINYIQKILTLRKALKSDFLFGIDDEEALWISATKGFMAGTGDIYTTYMTAEEYSSYQDSMSGTFEGIGVQIINNETNGNVEVVKVFKDSPAMRVGIQIGDQIVSADTTDLTGKSTEIAVSLLRGAEGTKVDVGILRSGVADILHFDVTRGKITEVFVTSYTIDEDIGYIYLSQFGDNTGRDVTNAAQALVDSGVKGIILDLRQNPGGGVLDALTIADYFLPKGEIIYTLDSKGNKVVDKSNDPGETLPLVLLVDENSASASEIVAGALQDRGRATVVGVTSFGKGIIQRLIAMPDKSLYKMTIQEYYVPSGRKIHGVGITPDVVIEMPEEMRRKSVEMLTYEQDVQLQKAVEVMNDLTR